MHPAFSVIFFTTLSGAGYGLIAWIGAMLAWGHLQGARLGGTTPLVFGALLGFALVLVTVGLLSSVGHLGQPRRAWRAFSQWRTSWLSREGVLALASYMPVLAFLALVGFDLDHPTTLPALQGPWLPVLAIAMAALALATVACTAMIYASLKPIPAWRQALVVPAYLAFALLTGGALLAMLLALVGLDAAAVPGYALVLGAGALATALVKLGYWRAIDRTPLAVDRGDAVGLPGRAVSVFERPHTESNYLLREMGYVVARRHADRLRAIALVLFAAVPLLAAVLAALQPAAAAPAFAVAALSALLGAVVERWLFFAQARHLVTLYY